MVKGLYTAHTGMVNEMKRLDILANNLANADTTAYKKEGTGKGYYISEGKAIPITWEKKSHSEQTVYKYENGEELKVNDGNTFIQIYPTTGSISIKANETTQNAV